MRISLCEPVRADFSNALVVSEVRLPMCVDHDETKIMHVILGSNSNANDQARKEKKEKACRSVDNRSG